MSGLQPGWRGALASAIQQIGPALRNRSVHGVFLGDELCGTANIPAANFTAVADEAALLMARWGGGEIYANEAVRAVNDSHWGPRQGHAASACFLPRVAAALTLFSLDFYAVAIESLRSPGLGRPLTLGNIYPPRALPSSSILVPQFHVPKKTAAFGDADNRRHAADPSFTV